MVDNFQMEECATCVWLYLPDSFNLAVAFCTLPVFRGASFCSGLPAERSGLPSHAATLPEHSATPEPYVSHNQCLLSGELMRKKTFFFFSFFGVFPQTLSVLRVFVCPGCDDESRFFFVSWDIAQWLVLVHCLSHPGYLSHWGNPPPKYTGKLHFNNFLECCLKIQLWDLGYNCHCKSSLLFTYNLFCLNVLFSSRKWTISVQQLWFSTQSTCAVSGSPNNKHLVPCDVQTLSFCVAW